MNLTGYCVDKSHRMLIYEFMSNGSLENLLYGGESSLFSSINIRRSKKLITLVFHKIFYFAFQAKECKS